MAVPENPTFSWSLSRHRTFAECDRRGYWHYYGSHLGWDSDAPLEAQISYRGKQLSTLLGTVGVEVHRRAAEIVDAIAHCEDWPSKEDAVARTRAALNALWAGSRRKDAFVRSPKNNLMLLDSWYGRPISQKRIDRTRDRMYRCLDTLYEWPGWTEVERTFPVAFEATDPVDYGGIPLYAAPDLVYQVPGEPWTIVDWKTGSTQGAEEQIGIYALYLLELGFQDFDGHAIGRVVALDDGEEETFEITPDSIRRARRFVDGSIRRLKDHLVGLDTEANEPAPKEQFRARPDEKKCRHCPFLELCENEPDLVDGPF